MRDRLAAPPTVENPNQADLGAQVYWLNCQPCHGDVGQGLTDDWRAQYPPEDQNCWESNCHGDRPYDSGFTLPRFVPAIIGPEALARFTTAADLYQFTRVAMPFNAPGSLSEAEYWQLTAYLLWANGQPLAADLSSLETAALIGLHGPLPAPTPAPVPAPTGLGWAYSLLALVGLVIIIGAGVWAWKRRQRGAQHTRE